MACVASLEYLRMFLPILKSCHVWKARPKDQPHRLPFSALSFAFCVQIFREGLDAMLNPPGSYCAYASVYLTVCLIRIFGLATKTYLEQQLHVGIIQVGRVLEAVRRDRGAASVEGLFQVFPAVLVVRESCLPPLLLQVSRL